MRLAGKSAVVTGGAGAPGSALLANGGVTVV